MATLQDAKQLQEQQDAAQEAQGKAVAEQFKEMVINLKKAGLDPSQVKTALIDKGFKDEDADQLIADAEDKEAELKAAAEEAEAEAKEKAEAAKAEKAEQEAHQAEEYEPHKAKSKKGKK